MLQITYPPRFRRKLKGSSRSWTHLRRSMLKYSDKPLIDKSSGLHLPIVMKPVVITKPSGGRFHWTKELCDKLRKDCLDARGNIVQIAEMDFWFDSGGNPGILYNAIRNYNLNPKGYSLAFSNRANWTVKLKERYHMGLSKSEREDEKQKRKLGVVGHESLDPPIKFQRKEITEVIPKSDSDPEFMVSKPIPELQPVTTNRLPVRSIPASTWSAVERPLNGFEWIMCYSLCETGEFNGAQNMRAAAVIPRTNSCRE